MNKKVLFLLCTIFVFVLSCKEDKDETWITSGPNVVEGVWKRDNTYPNVLAVFNPDFTSVIRTYDIDNNLKDSLAQGKYKISNDSLLNYKIGFTNKFKIQDDSLWVTYGYGATKETIYKYTRHQPQ